MRTITILVARLSGAEVTVLTHVGFAIKAFVDWTVAVIVFAVALFHFAVGDAPVHSVAA